MRDGLVDQNASASRSQLGPQALSTSRLVAGGRFQRTEVPEHLAYSLPSLPASVTGNCSAGTGSWSPHSNLFRVAVTGLSYPTIWAACAAQYQPIRISPLGLTRLSTGAVSPTCVARVRPLPAARGRD